MSLLQQLEHAVSSREKRGMLRTLRMDGQQQTNLMVDFSSNDYLGLARSRELESTVTAKYEEIKPELLNFGSTGSRLLSGDSAYAQQLENKLGKYFKCESALLFNSGYDANLSLLSSLPQADTVVLYDELVHNSCREGMRLCRSKTMLAFKHNSVEHCKQVLESQECQGKSVVIVVESLYSMDGDVAPIRALCDLASQWPHDCLVVVDEAHGTGVFGEAGRGLCDLEQQDQRVFCRIHTFGKALGCHGAVIVGPELLRKYLLNYARPLIYSTSLPVHSLVQISCAFDFMQCFAEQRQRDLFALVQKFRELAKQANIPLAPSESPIQAVMVSGNERVGFVAKQVQLKGFDVYPIRAPTVPAGEERIRVVLHSYNTPEEVEALVNALRECF